MQNCQNRETTWSKIDHKFMRLALKYAKKGRYTCMPNPMVGCVIAENGVILGVGGHLKAGKAHAEINALSDANFQVEGATAYVTLEPCCHHGRTKPCVESLIRYGIKKVVVAMSDPNPLVAGKGIKILKDAGIEVEVGLLEKEAKLLNRVFIKKMTTNRPYVTLKQAVSLDGKIALKNGDSKWITGPDSRADVQNIRAKNMALITGVNTVLIDDPSLNVRINESLNLKTKLNADFEQPTRIILDPNCQITTKLKIFTIDSPIILVSLKPYPQEERKLWPHYVKNYIGVNDGAGRIDLDNLLSYLGVDFNSVLVEAGATLASSFVAKRLIDELIIYQATKIIGASGQDMLILPEYRKLDELINWELVNIKQIGDDMRYKLRLKN